MKITKTTVIHSEGGFGMDRILLTTDLPSTTPNIDSSNATLRLDCAWKTGADYVREHFKMEPKIIETL